MRADDLILALDSMPLDPTAALMRSPMRGQCVVGQSLDLIMGSSRHGLASLKAAWKPWNGDLEGTRVESTSWYLPSNSAP